ncbi:PREDICTED: uncharacterized protein LOC108564029 [Nicrophorus vespilloides]|uniref:Uncharacterized protein LOC108564029 n=1 Tax=Nicrophorus vespilloides TaxID=110193 RepID=A0ABM1MUY8_NICVS|nr:PREDICTED: uncharacterized protein LOC108564029 [Nicrophorus vespilloides]
MMFLKLIGLLVIATIIKSEAYEEGEQYVDYYSHPKYTFSYGVEDFKTGDYKMHKEERNGDVVKGEYRVADPNGSIRTVTYTADKEHGFQAVVKQSEPIEASHILNENQEAFAEHKQNEEFSASSHYNYYHDGLSRQSKPDDSKQQILSKYTPSLNSDKYLHRFADDSDKKNKMQNQDISIYPSNKRTSQIKYNQQDDKNHEIETPKTHYFATGIDKTNVKQIEAIEYPKIKESAFQFVPKLNAAKSEDKKVKNVAQQFNFEYPALKMEYENYNPTEQLYYESKPKTQSSYFPVDFQNNYGYNLKQNVIKKPSGSQQNAAELKQSVPQLYYPNYGYNEATKDDYLQLFQQPQNGKIKNQDVFKKLEEHKPEYSYQSVVNGKSQVKSKVTQDTKTEKQSKPHLYSTQQQQPKSVSKKEEQKPAISYQTVINGQKSRLGNKQDNAKYYQVNQGPAFSFSQEAEKQQVYTPHIYNTDHQKYELTSPYESVVNRKSQENSKLLGLLIIATVIKSESYEEADKHVDYYAHPKYTFSYGVEDFKTGDYKTHKEERNGDGVKGEYRVADPNGSIRTVTYTADKDHGFQAVVKQSEPIEASHTLKENQEAVAEHKQNEELSATSQYNYYHDGSTQSKANDSKQKALFKYTPSLIIDKYLNRFTEKYDKKDEMQKQEIMKNIYSYNKHIPQFQTNQQEDIKSASETLKTKYFTTGNTKNVNNEQTEVFKQYPQMEEPIFQFVHKEFPKVNAVKSQDGKVKNVAQQFNSDFKLVNQDYNPSVTEYYAPQRMEKPNTQSTYFPVDFQTNYEFNFKQNAVQKPSGFYQNAADLKQNEPQLFNPKYGYDETTKQDNLKLFQQPQEMKNQNISKKVEEQKPAYSYQSVLNGKSHQLSKVTQDTEHNHQYKSLINKQEKPQLYFSQQQQLIFKKPVVTQEKVKYNQVSALNQGDEFKVVQEVQPFYLQKIDNSKSQENVLAYPYQSNVYGKSQDKPKTDYDTDRNQEYETLNKEYNSQKQQRNVNLMEEVQKPAISYQTIINGYKSLENTQEKVKYNQLLVLFIITTVIKSETHKKDDKLVDYFAPAKYTFSYGVEDFKTGDYKMHNEERNGDSVKGEYSVVDPDGSIRTVSYTVDKEHGYQAVVKQSEPLIVSTELKESQRINTQNKLSTKSSEYKHQSHGSSSESYNPDFNGEAFSKQTPINLVNSTENAHE